MSRKPIAFEAPGVTFPCSHCSFVSKSSNATNDHELKMHSKKIAKMKADYDKREGFKATPVSDAEAAALVKTLRSGRSPR